jgi:diguanylate cyclase (GGDEF)-like protein
MLAACICMAACLGVFFVLDGLATISARERRWWLFLAAVLAGGGTWATHFVAMLGYDPGISNGFSPGWTLVSAATSIAGAWLAFQILDRFPSAAGRTAAGALLGLAIIVMHVTGTTGIEAAAQRVWASDLLVSSWIFGIGFAIAALHAFALAPHRYRLLAGPALLVTAIVSLHFTGVAALTLVPDPSIAPPTQALDRQMLAVIIATGTAATLMIGVVLAFADRRVAAVELAAAKTAAAMAMHDPLTGLPNRRHLHTALESFLAKVDHSKRLAVVATDLDRFKPVNDLYGHAVGDELLVKIAGMFQEEAGLEGFVARLGGDEFILVLPHASDEELIARLSALIAKFALPIHLLGHDVSIGVSLGVAMAPTDGLDANSLMRRADVALYRAKEEGRGRFAFFEAGMDARVHERAALEHDLRIAIRNDEIVPHYQPLVQLATGEVTAFEVLARWPHAQRGLVPPDQFIKVAKETGLIGELTFNVLRRACRETLNWPGAPRISFNIAPVQLQDAALPQKILKVLSECGFPPPRLEIEITEDALVADFLAAKLLLISLKNLGVRISLDDFGTGYSSLRHLRELPFDVVKIDRSFVHDMGDSEEALTIVKTIVQLAKSMGLGVTAEGIETESQALELQALGCEHGQGFLLGRPAAGSTFITPDAATESGDGAPNDAIPIVPGARLA